MMIKALCSSASLLLDPSSRQMCVSDSLRDALVWASFYIHQTSKPVMMMMPADVIYTSPSYIVAMSLKALCCTLEACCSDYEMGVAPDVALVSP